MLPDVFPFSFYHPRPRSSYYALVGWVVSLCMCVLGTVVSMVACLKYRHDTTCECKADNRRGPLAGTGALGRKGRPGVALEPAGTIRARVATAETEADQDEPFLVGDADELAKGGKERLSAGKKKRPKAAPKLHFTNIRPSSQKLTFYDHELEIKRRKHQEKVKSNRHEKGRQGKHRDSGPEY